MFGGLGTWIDIYDTALYRTPNATAARLAARGVQTAWIETANDRSTVDVVERAGLGRLVDALHTQGIEVVAWYLPGHDRQARDLRRARAMLSFVTQTGGRFDGVALDIESLREKNVPLRTTRMLDLLTRLRAEAGSTPVAAITYPPRAFERHLSWWPNFPWSQIAAQVDAFVPMLYTGGGFPGYDATYGYVARSLRLLRTAVGRPIVVHAAGGVANRMNADELKAFSDAVLDDGKVVGLEPLRPADDDAGCLVGDDAPHRRPRLSTSPDDGHVRVDEVVALAEKRLAARDRERVAEAVAEVQPRAMSTLAVAPKALDCGSSLSGVHGYELDPGLLEEQVELARAFGAATALRRRCRSPHAWRRRGAAARLPRWPPGTSVSPVRRGGSP